MISDNLDLPKKQNSRPIEKLTPWMKLCKNADVFIGLSMADIVTNHQMLKKDGKANPIVFAMANPNPEIKYQLASRYS